MTIISGLSLIMMLDIAAAFGDFQGLINTTLKNDSDVMESRQNNK